jgi:hypothetical protein
MDWINRLNPGVPKVWLQLLAGITWTGVGIYLISLAMSWIFNPGETSPWIYIFPGIIMAFIIYRFGFSKLSIENSTRITDIPNETPCIFAFQEWHSYPLILLMIGLGIMLRKFTPIPKPVLGILYIGIGGGLGLASIHYYLRIMQMIESKQEKVHTQ